MTTQDVTIGGRPARIQTVRVRHAKKEWGFYNRIVGRWLDTNENFSMGSAQFAKWATALDRAAAKQEKGT